MEPLHAGLLVGPECGLERCSGIDAGEPLGPTQPRQGLLEPWPGHGLAPVDNGQFGAAITSNARPGEPPHGLAERQAFICALALARLELRERVGKSDVIDLDPLAAAKCEALRLRQQPLDLGTPR